MDNPKLQMATLLVEQGRFDLAQRKVEEYLADEPDSPDGHILRALCLIRARDREGIAAAARARELSPDEDRAHYVCALAELFDGRVAEAERSIRRAIEINSWVPSYFATLSTVHGLQSKWTESLAAADQGLELDPDDDGCLNQRAEALVKLDRKDEAEATLAGTLERNPEDSFTHANQGWTQLNRKKPQEAIVHFRESLRLNPESEWAKQGLLEALRARNWVYRQILAFFLWTAKFSFQTQMLLMVGMWLGMQAVIKLGKSYPVLEPFILVALLTYLGFVLSVWFGEHLMNAVLLFDHDGRVLLTKGKIITSLIAVVLLFTCLIVLGGLLITDGDEWGIAFRMSVLIAIHFASCLRLPAGRPRWIGIGASTIVAVMMLWLSNEEWKLIPIKNRLNETYHWLRDPGRKEHPDRKQMLTENQRLFDIWDETKTKHRQNDNIITITSIGVLILHSVLVVRNRRVLFER